ncbi:LIV-I protein F [Variovorax sp. PBS-H4]|uniref:ABC transporter ATP-binding protein n=1 Tax=Variovorax sp. PBS-H4 TaxID=434008 RepID=UPI001317FFB8|nr:ABC transporter ATP-binding protein [Variovorax sp. PBS-H4]VTU25542.1 LIV-I protein F [Variovorax sp. PBS-H4]
MLLEIEDVHAGYGSAKVLHGVSLSIASGQPIGLLGRNGMGRSTLINAVMGICRAQHGQIRWKGERIDHLPPHAIACRGIGLVPEGRRIFPNLNVRENLLVANRRADRPNAWTLERVLDFFPRLRERLFNPGNLLSGGEQQMLAIGRALLTNPDLLIFDEATEGLAPLIREEIWDILRTLAKGGVAMIVIDKDVESVSRVVERHYVIEKGCIVWQGSTHDFAADASLQRRYLSVSEGADADHPT